MRGLFSGSRIIEEVDEDGSTQGNDVNQQDNIFTYNISNSISNLISNSGTNRLSNLVQTYYARSLSKEVSTEVQQTAPIVISQVLTLPEEIRQILQVDESLFDLMRHKQPFKHIFGKDFLKSSACLAQMELSQQSQSSWIERRAKNYECFNSFFLAKQYLTQSSVLEIHHAQSQEKTSILSFLVAELLRESSGSTSTMISPQILYFDNSQQLDYELLQQMIQAKLLELLIVSASVNNCMTESQVGDLQVQAAMLSNQSLKNLLVIESRDLVEFQVNLRGLKHTLTTQKAIRVVIIDTINAFSIEVETNGFIQRDSRLITSTPVKADITMNDYHQSSDAKNKKRKGGGGLSAKGSLARHQESLIREYLNEIQRKFPRVSFVQTRRDYYKVRNLIVIDENSHSNFKASAELATILERDHIDINLTTHKSNKEIDFTNIYLMSMDNFSPAAIDKVLFSLKQSCESQLSIDAAWNNPQRISVVVRNNHLAEGEPEEGGTQEMNAIVREELKNYNYLMNFYTFHQGDFVPVSDSTFYFS